MKNVATCVSPTSMPRKYMNLFREKTYAPVLKRSFNYSCIVLDKGYTAPLLL